MPYLRCTESEDCGHRWDAASRFEDQCPECGAPAVPADIDDDRPEGLLAVPGRPGRAEEAHPAHARGLARRVLAEHDITKPPVPVLAVARRAGIEVIEVDSLGSLSARLIDGRIEVVSSDPPGRKRFSIAHELGHHFLHSVHGTSHHVESEADAFAGELLVPGHFLRSAVTATRDIDELRRLFQVSRQALEIAAATHKVVVKLS